MPTEHSGLLFTSVNLYNIRSPSIIHQARFSLYSKVPLYVIVKISDMVSDEENILVDIFLASLICNGKYG